MSRIAFLTRVLALSQVVPPSRSSAGCAAARVLLDQVEALDRDEELVVAGVAELHELLGVERRRSSFFRPTNTADAVIDVDDVVADLEVAEVREEACGARPRPTARRPRRRDPAGCAPRRRRRSRRPASAWRPPGGARGDRRRSATSTAAPRVTSAASTGSAMHVVLAQELDASARRGPASPRRTARSRPRSRARADVGDPIVDAAVVARATALAGDVRDRSVGGVDGQLLEPRAAASEPCRSSLHGTWSASGAGTDRPRRAASA